jgi:hypothetical protein
LKDSRRIEANRNIEGGEGTDILFCGEVEERA